MDITLFIYKNLLRLIAQLEITALCLEQGYCHAVNMVSGSKDFFS